MRVPVFHRRVRERLIKRANDLVKRGLERWKFKTPEGEIRFSSTLQGHFRFPDGSTALYRAMVHDDETVFYDHDRPSSKYEQGAPTVSLPIFLGQFPDHLVQKRGNEIWIDDSSRRLLGYCSFYVDDRDKIAGAFMPASDGGTYATLFQEAFANVRW